MHWGIELRMAVLNNYVVNVWKYTEYEERAVFKTFAEYTYEQRLINKNTNPSKSKFYKSKSKFNNNSPENNLVVETYSLNFSNN